MTYDGVNAATPGGALRAESRESQHEMLDEMRAHLRLLTMPQPARRLVDIRESAAAATTLSLRPSISALALIDTILYSVSAAAVLTIGARSIAIPAAGVGSLLVRALVVNPGDTLTLALSGGSPVAGPLHLEIIGWQVSPAERLEVIS